MGRKLKKTNLEPQTVNADVDERPIIAGFSPAPTTLLQAIERIAMAAEDSGLKPKYLNGANPEIDYLCKRMGLNRDQAILFAMVVNEGEDMTVAELGEKLDISTAVALSCLTDFKDMERKRLVNLHNGFRGSISISVPQKVVIRLANNKDFEYEPVSGLATEELIMHCNSRIGAYHDRDIDYDELCEEVNFLLGENRECAMVEEMNKLDLDISRKMVLLRLCHALVNGDKDQIDFHFLKYCFANNCQFRLFKRDLRSGTDDLAIHGLVTFGGSDGMVDTGSAMLTAEARERFLKDVELSEKKEDVSGVITCESISAKALFYDSEVAGQVEQLARFFEPGNYEKILERMRERNFRSAFTCLFYGGPGTGKTETVNQLARRTGRHIMLVDVPNLKDKWVGESEKNVKAVFDKYRALTKKLAVTPILLFNEADAVFSRRTTNLKTAVDRMNNTLQNIILQEMENLDGILIATTNLTDNLDAAFERRFLYKIRFERPGLEARTHIWHNMVPELTSGEAERLAGDYDFSGGQIENVARKFAIDNILYGNRPGGSMETLIGFCDNELIAKRPARRRVGFRS